MKCSARAVGQAPEIMADRDGFARIARVVASETTVLPFPPLLLAVALASAASLAGWLALLLHPARPWDLQPSDDLAAPDPEPWPRVVAIVPARNEASSLPRTLPALLSQDLPGGLLVILVEDRSEDGTGAVAARIARELGLESRLRVVIGAELPQGWLGKPWALEQGARAALQGDGATLPTHLLLTDADILHAPGTVKRLVAECVHLGVGLDSRMALLRCRSRAERLLVPAFDFFFAALYPMRRVNDARSTVAAAAGGCVLIDVEALRSVGGFSCIRDRVIDDVSLARAVKAAGHRLHLARSRGAVSSLRDYEDLGSLWRMVRRSAFTELRHSWVRLAACLAALCVAFVAPTAAALAALAWQGPAALSARCLTGFLAGSATAVMAHVYRPALGSHGLPAWRALTLPLAGILYGAMTLDSAMRHALGRPESWRARPEATSTPQPEAARGGAKR